MAVSTEETRKEFEKLLVEIFTTPLSAPIFSNIPPTIFGGGGSKNPCGEIPLVTTKERSTSNSENMMNKTEFAVKNGLNVCFIGGHGIGKTKGTLAKWEEMGYTNDWTADEKIYAYFNCPLIDVYEDIKGIPVNQDGDLVYIKPKHRVWDKVELVFFDEPNRAHPKIINTLYELIQLKSINGIKLPKLRCVFVAMNPHGEDYAVEACDQSFFDRFHLKINVEARLDKQFFVEKKGLTPVKFEQMVQWWLAIPENVRTKEVSPRRVEYCVDVFNFGGQLEDVIPLTASPAKLHQILSGSIKVEADDKSVLNIDKAKSFLDQYDHEAYKSTFVNNLKNTPKEILTSHFPYNRGSAQAKIDSERKTSNFVKYAVTLGVLDEAIDCFAGVPNLLIAVIKNRYFHIDSRKKAHDLLTACAPALATKFPL